MVFNEIINMEVRAIVFRNNGKYLNKIIIIKPYILLSNVYFLHIFGNTEYKRFIKLRLDKTNTQRLALSDKEAQQFENQKL